VIDSDTDFDVVYIGPLARAQRTDRVASIERYVCFIAQLEQVDPEVLDVADFDEAARQAGRDLSVPAELMRDPKEVEKLRAERQEQQKAMQEAALQQAQGDAAQSQGAGAEAMNA
jgi:hypothetical protein